jgi:hypothetical protein
MAQEKGLSLSMVTREAEAIGIPGEVLGAVEKNIESLQKAEGWGLSDPADGAEFAY